MKKTILVSAVIAFVVALGVAYFGTSKTIIREIVKEVRQLGAVSGPDLYSSYWNVNGVQTHYGVVEMATATSSLCWIASPSATTTLVRFTAQITTGTSTAVMLHVVNSPTANAEKVTAATSTTLLNEYSVAANVLGGINYIASSTALNSKDVIGPSRFIVLAAKNGAELTDLGIGTVYAGTCKAVLQQLHP